MYIVYTYEGICVKNIQIFFRKMNSKFLNPIFLQPDDVHLWYFKLILFDLTEFELSKIYNIGW